MRWKCDGGLVSNIQWAEPKIADLEPQVMKGESFLAEEQVQETNWKRIVIVRQSKKNFMLWNDTFFYREKGGFRFLPLPDENEEIMDILHDEIGNRDGGSTKNFVRGRFWKHGVCRGRVDNVISCDDCRLARMLPASHKSLRAPVN